MYDWRAEYEALLRQLPKIVTVAVSGDTGRAEDDVFVKVAIVGFGRYAPQTEWGWNHLLEVRRWRAGDYSDEALVSYGPVGARRYALLACAWLGTVLALFQIGSVSETDALTAYALLPGFVAGDAFEILERELE
jgi:hypothetical protein